MIQPGPGRALGLATLLLVVAACDVAREPETSGCAFATLPAGDCNPWLPPAASGRTWRLAFSEEFAGTSYDPGMLARRTTYYWRIDEVTSSWTTTGDRWSFFTMGIQSDLDRDADVDQDDFGLFQACLSGPGVAIGAGCAEADLDGDGDVDQVDLTAFQGCMNGANRAPDCTE